MHAHAPFVPHGASDRTVLQYLRGMSAHSDIVEVLWKSTRAFPDATLYSPDPARFAWVIAHTDGRVFAFAIGMHGIAVRLAPDDGDAAQAEGAEPVTGLDAWWLLRLYDGPSLAARCDHWIAQAHACACVRGQIGP